MPYGQSTCYTLREDANGGSGMLVKNEGQLDYFDTQEGVFCQLMGLEYFPNAFRVFSNAHAGLGRVSWGYSHRQKADCTVVSKDGAGGVHVAAFNYHGRNFHAKVKGQHRPGCPMGEGDEDGDYPDREEDEEKVRLAAALTRAAAEAGLKVVFSYTVVWCCSFICEFPEFDPRKELGSAALPAAGFSFPRLLLKRKYADKAVFSLKRKCYTQQQLVKMLRAAGPCAEGSSTGGFVVLEGGELEPKDPHLGYCVQRCRVKESEVGEFTKWQCHVMAKGDKVAAAKILSKYCREEQTLLRNSFQSASETLSVEYFIFLLVQKGLKNFKIRHFIHYSCGTHLSPWFDHILQHRHHLKRTGGSVLEGTVCKLTGNSYFGQTGMQASRFSNTSVVSEEWLSASESFTDYIHLTLLGAKKMKKGPPQLLYALTKRRDKAKNRNLAQIAGTILGSSKAHFLTVLSRLDFLLDPEKSEFIYCDTDSYFFCHSAEELKDCLRTPGPQAEAALASLFEADSERHQSGRLKFEKRVTGIYLRGSKSYVVFGGDCPEEQHYMRGVPKKIQSSLPPEVYMLDPEKNCGVVRRVQLAPSESHELLLSQTSLALTHSLNLKRVAQACIRTLFCKYCG